MNKTHNMGWFSIGWNSIVLICSLLVILTIAVLCYVSGYTGNLNFLIMPFGPLLYRILPMLTLFYFAGAWSIVALRRKGTYGIHIIFITYICIFAFINLMERRFHLSPGQLLTWGFVDRMQQVIHPAELEIWANTIFVKGKPNQLVPITKELPSYFRQPQYKMHVRGYIAGYDNQARIIIQYGGGFLSWGVFIYQQPPDMPENANCFIKPLSNTIYVYGSI